MSDKKYMRDRAICILELCKGFTTEPDNAGKAMLEMAGYVLDLTADPEPVGGGYPTIQEVEAEMINKSIEFAGEESEDRMTFRSGFWSCYNYLKKYESPSPRSKEAEVECIAGCMSFTGGERRHHKDCPFYPDSLTKAHEDEVNKLVYALKWCREMLVDKGLWGGNMINIKIDEIIKPYL